MTTANLNTNRPTGPQSSSSSMCAVCVCDTQPITAIGIRTLLNNHGALSFTESVDLLSDGVDFLHEHPASLLLIDKTFGLTAICEALKGLCQQGANHASIVVWGAPVSPAEGMHFLHAGARGIVRKTAEVSALIACLEAVAKGRVWVEDRILRDSKPQDHPSNALSLREQEVLDLVQQSLPNKEIAIRLGIQPGTVKIHVRHIFEKTGIHGRHSLALASFSQLQSVAAA